MDSEFELMQRSCWPCTNEARLTWQKTWGFGIRYGCSLRVADPTAAWWHYSSLSLQLSHTHTISHNHTLTHTPHHLYLLLWWNLRNSRPRFRMLILLFSLWLSHTLTITCCCCYDESEGTQDLKIYSHAHSLILSLWLFCLSHHVLLSEYSSFNSSV